MNYYDTYKNTKTAVNKIKELEKECVRLAKSTPDIVISNMARELNRFQTLIRQFRKTEDYQSTKIKELAETCSELTLDLSEANSCIENQKRSIKNLLETESDYQDTIGKLNDQLVKKNRTIIYLAEIQEALSDEIEGND